ncbi:hypothetical protein D9615_001173 [Tricholomella constricta]|uniref:Uncharacterized protein n=1 Tax=Tricholomella constricta TaxID=117010 RepID=A0A8H5HL21_9AGAR|nr:hypothetical protein D9615_001173 [Tricholomella constricta]
MQNNYPVLPSLSMLFADFDEFDSAGPTPADNPTFYKCGESSRRPERNAVFHLPANESFKMWRTAGLPYDDDQSCPPPSSSTLYHKMTNDGFGDWIQTDEMDMGDYDDEAPFTQASPHHAETQWPVCDAKERLASSIPASAARSSFESSPPNQRTSGALWHRSHHAQEPDLFGAASPLGASYDMRSYVEDDSHSPHMGPQPHNAPHDPTQSPYSYIFPKPSSASASAPIHIVSPLASSVSPASSSTSPSSSPDLIVRTPPIPIHQPRPERPIPIIPLSELASACEGLYIPLNSPKSSDLLSPLSPDFQAHYTPSFLLKPSPLYNGATNALRLGHGDEFHDYRQTSNGTQYPYSGGGPEIFCTCGCMGSYTFPQGNSM